MPLGLVAVGLLFLYKKNHTLFNQWLKNAHSFLTALIVTFFALTHSIAQDQKTTQKSTKQKSQITIDEISYDEMIQNQKENSGTWIPPYKKRRKTWGATISASYSFWQPNNYRSFFNPESNFQDVYGSASIGHISLLASLKLNHPVGALSLGLGGGYYKNKGNNNLDLSIFPLVAELTWTIDNIMSEPYFAPYGGIGLAYMYFREKQTSPLLNDDADDPDTSEDVKTGGQFVLYYNAGLLIQLDWLESSADSSMYYNGIENTYIKVGIMSFLRNIEFRRNASDSDKKDFKSNKLTFFVGLQLEF